jgi:hypothetical protein
MAEHPTRIMQTVKNLLESALELLEQDKDSLNASVYVNHARSIRQSLPVLIKRCDRPKED